MTENGFVGNHQIDSAHFLLQNRLTLTKWFILVLKQPQQLYKPSFVSEYKHKTDLNLHLPNRKTSVLQLKLDKSENGHSIHSHSDLVKVDLKV